MERDRVRLVLLCEGGAEVRRHDLEYQSGHIASIGYWNHQSSRILMMQKYRPEPMAQSSSRFAEYVRESSFSTLVALSHALMMAESVPPSKIVDPSYDDIGATLSSMLCS